jgi:hypothetical protein
MRYSERRLHLTLFSFNQSYLYTSLNELLTRIFNVPTPKLVLYKVGQKGNIHAGCWCLNYAVQPQSPLLTPTLTMDVALIGLIHALCVPPSVPVCLPDVAASPHLHHDCPPLR